MEMLKKLTLQQDENRKKQEEDRKQQAQHYREVVLQMDALNAELNRASQTS